MNGGSTLLSIADLDRLAYRIKTELVGIVLNEDPIIIQLGLA
jgi:hypothetical protein